MVTAPSQEHLAQATATMLVAGAAPLLVVAAAAGVHIGGLPSTAWAWSVKFAAAQVVAVVVLGLLPGLEPAYQCMPTARCGVVGSLSPLTLQLVVAPTQLLHVVAGKAARTMNHASRPS